MDKLEHIKAKGKPDWTSLYDHLRQVETAVLTFANYTGHDTQIVRLASILHDIGKVHPVFQKQLKGRKPVRTFRHELASLFFIPLIEDKHREVVIEMIVAHHKSIKRDAGEKGILDLVEYEPNVLKYHLGDWEQWMSDALKILQLFDIKTRTIDRTEAENAFNFAVEFSRETWKKKRGPSEWKGLMMGGDYFASALIDKTEQATSRLFQTPELKFYERQHPLYPLSYYSANSACPHTMVVACTGAGKTDYLMRRCNGRVFYTLPFQASINAMYKRFKNELSEDNPNLDLRVLHAASSLVAKEDPDEDVSLQELMGSTVKVLTPYQLAGIALGTKGYESVIMDLKGCDVILDEVHTYSDISQAIILKVVSVLKHLSCKIHIGTATMPSILYNKIFDILGPDEVHEVKLSEEELEDFNRHTVHKLGVDEEYDSLIEETVNNDQKVLIVCNRVDRAQAVFRTINEQYPEVEKLLLHSRFKRKDRNEKERLLIGKDEEGNPLGQFNTSTAACIVVSTQVVEVSLDISFDLMITEAAPLDALIQRFGRVNRERSENNLGQLKPVYVLAPPEDKNKARPYDLEVLQASFEVLPDGVCLEEKTLQEKIDQVYTNIDFVKIEEHSVFKDDERWTIPTLTHNKSSVLMDLLEIDSVTCIKEEDVGSYQELDHDERMLYEIPARNWQVKSLPTLNVGRKPFVIPDAAYNEEIGMMVEALHEVNPKAQIL